MLAQNLIELNETRKYYVKMDKQVDKSHYDFSDYMSRARWSSVWHQLDEVIKLNPFKVLEIGPGRGLFKSVAGLYGVDVETLDIDPELCPDYVSRATSLPFTDNSYDVVCAFQVLEHMPYQDSLKALCEMVRVSKSAIIISLPDAKPLRRYVFFIPILGHFDFLIPRLFAKPVAHKFDGEHYWEVNKADYPLSRIISDFVRCANIIKTFRVKENPYHRFFIFKK